jgi:hypothetical protein
MIALTLEERYDELAAMRSLRDLNARPTYRFEVKRREKGVPGGELYPMRIARQALSMVLVVSPPGYPKERSQLVKLVLNPAENAVPIGVRLGFCFYVGQLARTYGYAGAADLETGELRVMTEVSHPPLSWIMAVGGTSLPSGLIDVTHWLGLDYDDTLIDVGFEAQLGFGESLLPADYRTLGQRETQAQLSDRGRAR